MAEHEIRECAAIYEHDRKADFVHLLRSPKGIESIKQFSGSLDDAASELMPALSYVCKNKNTGEEYLSTDRELKIVLVLPDHVAAVRTMNMPRMSADKIHQVVKYEAEQQIPFPLDQVDWNYSVTENVNENHDDMEVRLLAMRRDAVGKSVLALKEAGIVPTSVTAASEGIFNVSGREVTMFHIGGREYTLVVGRGSNYFSKVIHADGADVLGAEIIRTLNFYNTEFATNIFRAANQEEVAKDVIDHPVNLDGVLYGAAKAGLDDLEIDVLKCPDRKEAPPKENASDAVERFLTRVRRDLENLLSQGARL